MTTMRAFRYAALFFAALVLASAGGSRFALAAHPASESGTTERPPHLRLLTGPNGGQWFTAGERLAPLLTGSVVPTSSRIG
jgi:hypothetical protein